MIQKGKIFDLKESNILGELIHPHLLAQYADATPDASYILGKVAEKESSTYKPKQRI